MFNSDQRKRNPPPDQGFAVITAIVLCCLIVGVLSFSVGRDSERDSQRTSLYQKYGERRENAFCVDLVGDLLEQCRIEQEQAVRETYHAVRDLEAQRDMSFWALAVFVISAISAGLTLWALWYVRGTLYATLRIGQAQTRAYLSIDKFEVRLSENGLSFKATVKNSGNSPAFAAQIIVKVIDKDGGAINLDPFEEHTVPAQSSVEFSECFWIIDTKAISGAIVVKVEIGYADVFGEITKIGDRFANLSNNLSQEYKAMVPGGHIASYIRATEGGINLSEG